MRRHAAFSPGTSATTLVDSARAKDLLLEQCQLIADARGLFELEVLGMLEHLLFETLDLSRDLFFGHDLVLSRGGRSLEVLARSGRVVDAVDHFAHVLDDAARSDVVGRIEQRLLLAPPIGFIDRALH